MRCRLVLLISFSFLSMSLGWLACWVLLSLLVDSEILAEPGFLQGAPFHALVSLESTFLRPVPVCVLTHVPKASFYIQQSVGHV